MAASRDGGRAAIAGFLYQIVGVLGFQACAYASERPDDDTGESELSTLVQRTREATAVSHEMLDQDALLELLPPRASAEPNQTHEMWIAVQFKYSINGVRSTIGPEELGRIETAFRRLEGSAVQRGVQVHERYLVTNRRVVDDNLNWANQHQIIIVQRESLDHWYERLESFGYRYGCTKDEISNGTDVLVGKILRMIAANDGVSIDMQDLVEAFTNNRNATPLMLQSVFQNTNDELQRLGSELGLANSVRPLRRSIVDEIAAYIAERRALIFLLGKGGCGKTVSLWQWTCEVIGDTEPRSFAAFTRADDATRTCVTEQICKWSSHGHLQHLRWAEPSEIALCRLELANPDMPLPVFHLALDGLDEVTNNSHLVEVKELLRWFWKQDQDSLRHDRHPKAVLVVTCRKADDFSIWLPVNLSGFGTSGSPAQLVLDEFSDIELRAVADDNLTKSLASRVRLGLASDQDEASQGLVMTDSPTIANLYDPSRLPAETTVLKAIRHPAMWRSFLTLSSDEQRDRILSGNEAALRDLAERHIDWFRSRASRRDPNYISRQITNVMQHIAQRTYANQARQRVSTLREWNDHAREAADLKRPEARWLFDEASSAGLIEEIEPQGWRWRHEFVARYLAETAVNSDG